MSFQVNRYDDFLGTIPQDILDLVPEEDRSCFFLRLLKNTSASAVTGWKVVDGKPFPVVQGINLKGQADF